MNNETFEQLAADQKAVGDSVKWLVENDVCTLTLWNGSPIAVTPPNFVELEITETEARYIKHRRGGSRTSVCTNR